jgi:hypothetical protein
MENRMEAADPDYSPDESKLKLSLEIIGILPGRKPSHLIVVVSMSVVQVWVTQVVTPIPTLRLFCGNK